MASAASIATSYERHGISKTRFPIQWYHTQRTIKMAYLSKVGVSTGHLGVWVDDGHLHIGKDLEEQSREP